MTTPAETPLTFDDIQNHVNRGGLIMMSYPDIVIERSVERGDLVLIEALDELAERLTHDNGSTRTYGPRSAWGTLVEGEHKLTESEALAWLGDTDGKAEA